MIKAEDSDKRPIRSVEKPVLLSSVRLVHKLTDPETGITRDVIVKKLEATGVYVNRHTGAHFHRVIPGLGIKVPWHPFKKVFAGKEFPNDTARMDVEAKTFVPTLLRPPIPTTVINELRNKYSKFRTRHDPEYIEAKMAEDREKEERKKLAKQMRTPLKENNRKLRKLRKKLGKGTLTPEMLEKIGQIIANKKQLVLNTAGMSSEEPVPEPLAA